MGSLGYIVGGALQGVGAGMAQKAEMDARDRRELAMENLRQQNSEKNMRIQATLNDENSANSDARKDYYGARDTARQASVDTARDQRKFGYEVQLKKMDFANDEQRLRLQSALGTQADAASKSLAAQIEAGQIRQIVESGDGQYYAIRGDGTQFATGVKVPPKALESGGGSTVAGVLAARGNGAGIGSAAGTAPAKSPAPAKPIAKPATPKPTAIKPGSKGTVSMAEVDALAKARGLSRAEALRFAEGQGFAVQKGAPQKAPPKKPAPSMDERWKKGLSGQTK